MKRSLKEVFVRLIILLIGLTIAHIGVTLFLLADLGSDPFNVLIQGIFRTTDRLFGWQTLTHGRVHIAICFLIILVLVFLDKTYVKIGTLLCMICGGPIIDVCAVLFQGFFNSNSSFALRIAGLAIGCVILAFGMTIVIKSDAGTGSNDLVAIVISDKLHRSFPVVRILVDVGFVVIGYFLGGSFGVGTIICAFLVGPVAGLFMPFNEKWIQSFVSHVIKV